jgi:hypothetical protein
VKRYVAKALAADSAKLFTWTDADGAQHPRPKYLPRAWRSWTQAARARYRRLAWREFRIRTRGVLLPSEMERGLP